MSKLKATLVSSKRLRCGVTAAPQYLSGPDIYAGHVGIPIVLLYRQGLDVAALEAGLLRTLKHYPIICGRVRKDAQGQQLIDSNDAGMDWRVHRCDGPTPPYGLARPVGRDIRHYHQRVLPWHVVNKDQALLQIDVYRFDDGGHILCFNGVHSLFDGSAWWQFMVDWARTCRGEDFPAVSFERAAVISAAGESVSPDMKGQIFEPTWAERLRGLTRIGLQAMRLRKEVFRIPASRIEQWKQQARVDLPDSPGVSTVELATAFCMHTLSPLLPPGKARSVGIVLDLRHKRRLRIPRDYFGNALGYGEARYTQQEMAGLPLAALAERCRPAPEDVQTDRLVNYLALMEQYRQKKANWRLFWRAALETVDAGLVLNNCVHFPMYNIDFGGGAPQWYDITGVAFRMLMVVPTPEQDGGVDLHLTALPAELAAMAKACP